ncbi:DUF3958 family protein [Listeria welshimeri]|uniref:DUF3958 family protein n=1 Tax=Listeria welshimeri TaxID=1643 RepID=UPI001623BD0F|nr:DUF3958 family protein [Listeria welshimeri]MBC1703123.1 DUF3958 family protein [Listeria welshimeri]MBC1782518.1 DUF3958 family protein [Listeria welshimeri]MBC1971517.1 DUF3958 family protein [Listeria welshimeri]MBC1991612.1 DUF3958 family protein [Listeria welshimeri]MBC2006507.1 DUF3958 family protein [Listeria welshimeri]
MDKIDEINIQINILSKESEKAERTEYQLKLAEEALRMHVHRRTCFFDMLQDYWQTGDMAGRIVDRKWQLQREEHQTFDTLEEKRTAIRRQIQELETQEDDLYRARKQAWEEIE